MLASKIHPPTDLMFNKPHNRTYQHVSSISSRRFSTHFYIFTATTHHQTNYSNWLKLMEDLHDYGLYVMAQPAMPTYGIKKVSHRKMYYKSRRALLLHYTIYLKKKLAQFFFIGMENTKFATSWYYSRVQLIDG